MITEVNTEGGGGNKDGREVFSGSVDWVLYTQLVQLEFPGTFETSISGRKVLKQGPSLLHQGVLKKLLHGL